MAATPLVSTTPWLTQGVTQTFVSFLITKPTLPLLPKTITIPDLQDHASLQVLDSSLAESESAILTQFLGIHKHAKDPKVLVCKERSFPG